MWNPNDMLERGERAVSSQFRGGWSPTSRMLMTGFGLGLFVYGLTRSAPTACVLGTLGGLLVAEGVTNANLSGVAQGAMDLGRNVGMGHLTGGPVGAAMGAAHSLGLGSSREPATAGR